MKSIKELVVISILTVLLAGACQLQAGVATGNIKWNNIVRKSGTQDTWKQQIVAKDTDSNATATIEFSLSLTGGGKFTKLDGNSYVGGSGGSDRNSIDMAESVVVTAKLVSRTGGASDIGVSITHLGLRGKEWNYRGHRGLVRTIL